MTNATATRESQPVRVSVEFRRPVTRRHRARYVVRYAGKVVSVIPRKDWEHAEAYIRAAAKVTGLAPEDLATDGGLYRTTGWRWFTTDPNAHDLVNEVPLARRGRGVPRR